MDPEDIPLLGSLLSDDTNGPPALRCNIIWHDSWDGIERGRGDGDTAPVLWKEWKNRTVSDYASLGLKLMTWADLNRTNFAGWWQANQDVTNQIWFWRERLHCEMGEADAYWLRRLTREEEPGIWMEGWTRYWQDRRKNQAVQIAGITARVCEELRGMDPVLEAKIRFGAMNEYSSGLGMELGNPLLGRFTQSRLPPAQLMGLLRRAISPVVRYTPEEWEDIQIARGISGVVDEYFGMEQVDELRLIASTNAWLRTWLIPSIQRITDPSPAGMGEAEEPAAAFLPVFSQ